MRKQIIFCGDNECYKEARRASDGFEHGFLGFDELHALAKARRNQTASYLRTAIIEVVGCNDSLRDDLKKNEVAVGAWKVVRYFRGRLLGEGSELAAPGQEYPILNWRSTITSITNTPTGGLAVVPSDEFTPRLAEGISLIPGSYEVWGPETGTPRETVRRTVTPIVKTAKKQDPKRDKVIGALEKINRAVLDYGANRHFESRVANAFVLAIFAECRSRFRAVFHLLTQNLANEALELSKGIFRNATRLLYLRDESEKMPTLLGWAHASTDLTSAIHAASEAANVSLHPGESLFGDVNKEQLEKITSVQNMTLREFPAEPYAPELATPLFRLGNLASERIINGFGPLVSSYGKVVEGEVLSFGDTCEETDYLAFVAAYASEAVILACRATGQVFHWPDLDDVGNHLDLLRSILTTQSPPAVDVTATES